MLLFRVVGDVFVLCPDHREEAEEMFAGRRRSFLLVITIMTFSFSADVHRKPLQMTEGKNRMKCFTGLLDGSAMRR